FCLTYIGETVKCMTKKAKAELGDLPVVYAGGVMSNKYIKSMILEDYDAYFAQPEFSCDNAAGVSVIAFEKYKLGRI
ncbi:MAG: peptidase M22, partial [Porcipelethomonas sp.]